MSGERRQFLVNVASGLGQLGAGMVTSVLLYRLFVDSLGLAATGVWVVVATLGDLMALLELGAGTAVIKLGSEARGRASEEDFAGVMRAAFRVSAWASGAVMAITTLLCWGLVSWFAIAPAQASAARWALLLVGLDTALTLASAPFRLALQSTHRYDTVNWLYSARWIVRFAALWAGLAHWPSLVLVAAVGLACNTTVNAISAAVAWRRVPLVREGLSPAPAGPWPRRIAGYAVWVAVSMVASRLAYSMDALLVGAFLGLREVALYNAGWRIVEVIRALGQAVVPFFLPMASERAASGRETSVAALFYQGVRLVVLVTYPLCALALGAGDSLLALWLGRDFTSVFPILWVLLVPQVAIMTVYPSGPIAYGLGRQKTLVLYGLTSAAANFALSVLLVRRLGMLGVALGTSITLVACGLINLWLHPRLIGFSLRIYLRIVGRGVAVLVFAVGVLRAVKPAVGELTHLVVALVLAAAVAPAFLVWELTAAERVELVSSLRGMLDRRPAAGPREGPPR
jgi:O-antigen/teichoic acid export membrane protein